MNKAEYYLPVKIGRRRMHSCHLQSGTADFGFEFIIPLDGNDVELFSMVNEAHFISSNGSKKDVRLKDVNHFIKEVKRSADRSVMEITILFAKEASPESDASGIEDIIAFESNQGFAALVSSECSVKKFIFTIGYFNGSQKYSYRFIIHTPVTSAQTVIHKVAIDFGSEASQIGCRQKAANANHDDFIRIADILKTSFYKEYAKQDRFWQANDKTTPYLFKSVFFVSKNPQKGFLFSDPPNKYREDSILQLLLPLQNRENGSGINYDKLYLLPNLKLIELTKSREFLSDTIYFNDAATYPGNYTGHMDILHSDMIADFTRLILAHFLHTVLQNLNVETGKEKYLQVTLLVPNVYAQEKVYTLVTDFYKDFNDIVRSQYKKFSGIEVFVMSESDASFIGAKTNPSGAKQLSVLGKKNGKYLVIDAGKGTTDFSILQQQGANVVKFDSLFRAGLPGSGQFISYAFIEALEKFLHHNGIWDSKEFNNAIKKANKVELVDFLDRIEELKKNYSTSAEVPAAQLKNLDDIKNQLGSARTVTRKMNDLVEALGKEFLEENIRIPGSTDRVKYHVNTLIDEIENSIYKSGEKQFYQVILAGRAFLFEPLQKAIKDRFKDRVTSDQAPFIFHGGINSKTICIDGAFQNETTQINLNSELIGNPIILNQSYDPYVHQVSGMEKVANWFASFFEKKETVGGGVMNEDFFYAGYSIDYKIEDKYIKIGARLYAPPSKATDEKKFRIVYTGNGFLLQWENGADFLEKQKLSTELTDMVKKTLYPFAEREDGKPPKEPNDFTPATPVTPSPSPVEPPLKEEQQAPDEEQEKPNENKDDNENNDNKSGNAYLD